MTKPKRTIEITITVKEGYDTLMTETLRAPADIDLTRLQVALNHRLGEAILIVDEVNPITAETDLT